MAEITDPQEVVTGIVADRLLTTHEVAVLFQVTTRTVNEWAKRGRIATVRTPGGQRRFPGSIIARLLTEDYESELR
jgi:excisionase family DNA binding protein